MIVLVQPVIWPVPGPRNRQPGPADPGPHRDVTDPGTAPPGQQLGNFYVIGPQDDTPQSEDATFVHDHTVAGTPQQNHGSYRVHLRGIFVLCSAEGLATGACIATFSPLEGAGTLPLATTVNGQSLTSVEAIEAAAEAGLVTLQDTGAVLVGTISGK